MPNMAAGTRVILKANPARSGTLTDKRFEAGGFTFVQVRMDDGELKRIKPEYLLEVEEVPLTILDAWQKRSFAKNSDLRAQLTEARLSGDLRDHLYSLNSGRLEFMPHQFKPVIKFINSPNERLLIADEVGLGKTIEAALIWQELQVRRQARRLVIVCPKMLTTKWRDELYHRFDIRATIGTSTDLLEKRELWKKHGGKESFVLILPYSALRPNRAENEAIESGVGLIGPRAQVLHEIDQDTQTHSSPFMDLLIMDEAHYLRNPGAMVAKMGLILARSAGGVLLLSATPVSNKNSDLLTLLRLLDPDYFKEESSFDNLLDANRPAIEACNSLMRIPPQVEDALKCLRKLESSAFVGNSAFLQQALEKLGGTAEPSVENRLQAVKLIEQLNVLNQYISRTRRIHVQHERPVRKITPLPVHLTPLEAKFYSKVVEQVKETFRESTRSSPFDLIHPQLRMSSCLPDMAEAYGSGGGVPSISELEEAGVIEDDEEFKLQGSRSDFSWVREFIAPLRQCDSKYKLFLEKVRSHRGNKALVFSFFKGTLRYLEDRLRIDGIKTAVIHGDISPDERFEQLKSFENDPSIEVLLTSEVGSEGLDLQFAHILFNYDLPWNPMRIEQRIGRIDRIGQKAKELIIYNFKIARIPETTEERIYELLFQKILAITGTIGTIEPVVADASDAHIEALRDKLSSEERQILDLQAKGLIDANHKLMRDQLAEEETNLLGVNSYITEFISKARSLNRSIDPEDIRNLINDFFQGHFAGTRIVWHHEKDEVEIGFSSEAENSYLDFIRTQRLSSSALLNRKLVGRLNNDATFRRSPVEHLNHLHPLVKWIVGTSQKESQSRCLISFLACRSQDLAPVILPAGTYLFEVAQWTRHGLRNESMLSFSACALAGGGEVSSEEAEALVIAVARMGQNRCPEDVPSLAEDKIAWAEEALDQLSLERFSRFEIQADAENAHQVGIRRAQINSRHDERERVIEAQIAAYRSTGTRSRMDAANLGRLERIRQDRVRDLERLAQAETPLPPDQKRVALGLIQLI